jgi:predicted nucleic acid-binding protein
MRRAFADSYFYLALADPRDADHAKAKEIGSAFDGAIVTTQWVLVEVADALCAPKDRKRFLGLLQILEADPKVTIVSADSSWFEKGLDFYGRRPDKEWSLTDCTSFVVMEHEQIREALTADIHFEQAGFIALLRDGT